MKSGKEHSYLVPTIVLTIVAASLLLIPLKVIGYGYLPSDDALRHAAKAVSGKGWDEILVMRSEKSMDNHPGWHAILGFLNRAAGWNTDTLVVFSVAILFALFALPPILLLRRPEAWITTLLVFSVAIPSFIGRIFFGRPFIVTIATIVILCLLWPKLKNPNIPYRTMAAITLLVALSTWVHGSWYLFALPVASFFLAREWRAGGRISLAVICGIILGALFTGRPFLFLKENITHMFLAFGNNTPSRLLVGEFQPFLGDPMTILVILGMLAWRRMRGAWDMKAIDNPVFILAACGWVLGFIVKRFWFDWGIPAFSVWMALEFQAAFKDYIKLFSWRRVILTAVVASSLYLAVTNDANSRWTLNLTTEYLSAGNPEHAEWLPDKGGIIYSDEMLIFYDTFFKNPKADWRYILGFEPALMPPDDLAIFRKIQWNYGDDKAFEPWVKKMRPSDRLILRRLKNDKPSMPGLEWHYAATGIWVGRLPRHQK